MKRTIPALAGGLLVAFGSLVYACDGWRQVERKNDRYEHLDLTAEQKQRIEELKQQAIAQFREDHKHGGCDERHEQTLAGFQAEADGVLTSAQRMEVRTGEKLANVEEELRQLRAEVRELKALIKELAAARR